MSCRPTRNSGVRARRRHFHGAWDSPCGQGMGPAPAGTPVALLSAFLRRRDAGEVVARSRGRVRSTAEIRSMGANARLGRSRLPGAVATQEPETIKEHRAVSSAEGSRTRQSPTRLWAIIAKCGGLRAETCGTYDLASWGSLCGASLLAWPCDPVPPTELAWHSPHLPPQNPACGSSAPGSRFRRLP